MLQLDNWANKLDKARRGETNQVEASRVELSWVEFPGLQARAPDSYANFGLLTLTGLGILHLNNLPLSLLATHFRLGAASPSASMQAKRLRDTDHNCTSSCIPKELASVTALTSTDRSSNCFIYSTQLCPYKSFNWPKSLSELQRWIPIRFEHLQQAEVFIQITYYI